MSFFSRFWGPRGPKILVVEDSPEIAALVKDILASGGYDATIAGDGVEGLALFRKEKFELLILDYNMPRMGGAEMLKAVRADPKGRKLAVIMLSAERMLDPIYKAYDQGIVAWVPKPFEADALLAKVVAQLNPAPK